MAKRQPRKTKQTSVKQILKMEPADIAKMNNDELRKMITIANSAANKRLKRAQKAGVTSAVIDRTLEKGKFSVKGLDNRLDLENAFTRVRQFLSAKTSKTRGIKSAQKKMFKALAKVVNPELGPKEKLKPESLESFDDIQLQEISGKIWQMVDKVAEDKSLGITRGERYRLAAHGYKVTTRNSKPVKTKAGLFRSMKHFYNKLYGESIKQGDIQNLSEGEQRVVEIYKDIT